MTYAGAYVKIVAPRSTLAQSLAFSGEHRDLVAEYHGLATVVGKYITGVEELAELEQIQAEFEHIPNG